MILITCVSVIILNTEKDNVEIEKRVMYNLKITQGYMFECQFIPLLIYFNMSLEIIIFI